MNTEKNIKKYKNPASRLREQRGDAGFKISGIIPERVECMIPDFYINLLGNCLIKVQSLT